MPTHLIVAEAAFGKTQAMLALCREATQALDGGPRRRPLLCVSSAIQRESAQRRLARMGGALGVRVVLFDELYTLILRTQQPLRLPVEVESSTQRRLMRTLAAELAQAGRLAHFAPVADMPGFHSLALDLLLELEAAAVPPDALAAFLHERPASARLRDLGLLYSEWQRRLHKNNWVNRQGMGRLALEALRDGRARLPAACSPIIFDGFDSFTRIQLDLIAALHETHACAAPASGQPAADLHITLTGNVADRGPVPERRAHRRFHGTRLLLQERLGIEAEPLLPARPMETWRKPLLHLEQTLFSPVRERLPAEGAVHFVEASNRALEARAALRWLKEQVVLHGVAPEECAVVARSIDPYLPHILGRAADAAAAGVCAAAPSSALAGGGACAVAAVLGMGCPGTSPAGWC